MLKIQNVKDQADTLKNQTKVKTIKNIRDRVDENNNY